MTIVKSKISRKSCLKKALLSLGFKEHQIEDFGETKEKLKGYQGDWRKQECNIRIKGSGWRSQNYVGGCSNDIGFELQADGTYTFHVSEYDSKSNGYGKDWQNKLTKLYSKEVVKEVCGEQNFFISSEEEEGGELVLKLSSPF